MRAHPLSLTLHAVAAAFILGGCSRDNRPLPRECTAELRLFPVEVRAPHELVVDNVTAENSSVTNCGRDGMNEPSKAASQYFHCPEQGAGRYEIIVHVGARRWTKTVEIKSDGCHIKDAPKILVDLTAEAPTEAQP